jgi:alginate O-acetyltransferase complex protein AlgI
MVFTSISFLFLFLPVFLATHFITATRWRNAHILILSLFFYLSWQTCHPDVSPEPIARAK